MTITKNVSFNFEAVKQQMDSEQEEFRMLSMQFVNGFNTMDKVQLTVLNDRIQELRTIIIMRGRENSLFGS